MITKESQKKEFVMITKKIWLDLDGCFANMAQKLIEVFGPNYKELSANALWRRLQEEDHLFLHLNEIEDAQSLLSSIIKIADEYNCELEFLTALPYSTGNLSTSRDDKILWVKRHLSTTIPVSTIVGGTNKYKFANAEDILIDDYQKNLGPWETAGGIGILHESNNTAPTLLKLFSILESQK